MNVSSTAAYGYLSPLYDPLSGSQTGTTGQAAQSLPPQPAPTSSGSKIVLNIAGSALGKLGQVNPNLADKLNALKIAGQAQNGKPVSSATATPANVGPHNHHEPVISKDSTAYPNLTPKNDHQPVLSTSSTAYPDLTLKNDHEPILTTSSAAYPDLTLKNDHQPVLSTSATATAASGTVKYYGNITQYGDDSSLTGLLAAA